MNDLRARAKAFYDALDFDRPINFGQADFLRDDRAKPASVYVENLHGGDGTADPVVELADQIDFAASAGAYLFTGNRGTGKTTELMRLARRLQEYGYEVFYVDLAEYLNLTQRVEITDFLMAVLGGLSDKVYERVNAEAGTAGFFARAWSFLKSEVKIEEISLPAGPAELKAALVQNPHFKGELQRRARGHVQTLVEAAREFVLEVVEVVRKKRLAPDLEVVLLVDSLERLRGVGSPSEIGEVFRTVATLFVSHADALRFTALSVVYTIPPYLQGLAGGLDSLYAGGRMFVLPSAQVYECCPEPGQAPQVSEEGIDKLLAIVARRFEKHADFFSETQLRRLAQSSGGDLRDFFRMARLAITRAASAGIPLTDAIIQDVEDAVRSDMLPIAADDREWLVRIARSCSADLPSFDRLPDLARLQEGKYVLQHRNGRDWYYVHPLLRKQLGLG